MSWILTFILIAEPHLHTLTYTLPSTTADPLLSARVPQVVPSGEVLVSGRLDAEARRRHLLEVTARDAQTPHHTAAATIELHGGGPEMEKNKKNEL